jgi:O-antigen ligase
MVALICASAAAGLFHAFYSDMFSNIINYSSISNLERYQGTSNTSITYGNMCATLFLIASYYIFYRGNKSYHLILSAIIFLILFILTAARGPLVGIILGLSYLFFVITYDSNRRSNLKYFIAMLSIFLIIIIVIPNPMVERLKNIKHVDLTQPFQIEHISLRERVFMFNFSIEQIQDKYIMGVGPQNVQDRMDDSLNLKAPSMFLDSKIGNIYSKDHLHNDLLDITLKFGLISLILLLFIYFYLINSKNTEHRVLLYMLMIMLVSSQMTQSHFAHHQAITFYIILFYLFQSKVNRITK